MLEPHLFKHPDCMLETGKDRVVPKARPHPGCIKTTLRVLQKWIVVSSKNQNARYYFVSDTAIQKEIKNHLTTCRYIIHPFSQFTKYCEIFMLFIWILTLLNDIFSFSFRECLNQEKSITASWVILVATLNFICCLDIARHFGTGYMDSYTKKSILEPKKIALHYIRTWFLVDWIAVFVLSRMFFAFYFLKGPNHYFRFIGVLRYIRVARIATVIKNIKWITDFFNATYTQYMVISITIVACYIWHFNACFYVSLPFLRSFHKGIQSNMSWVAHVSNIYRMNNLTVTCIELYSHSLFECLLKMNLGMLNVYVPHEFDEVLFVIYCIITGFFFKAIVFIFIYFIYDTTYHSTVKFTNISNHIYNYLFTIRSDDKLQSKIQRYLDSRYANQIYTQTQKYLSHPLRLEVYTELWRNETANRKILKTLPQRLTQKIFSSFELEIYLPNHVIYTVNQRANRIYFLCSGSIAIYKESGKEVCHLKDSSYFGLGAFTTPGDNIRKHTAVTLETCEVLIMLWKDLQDLADKFPDLKNFISGLLDDYHTGYAFFSNFKKDSVVREFKED